MCACVRACVCVSILDSLNQMCVSQTTWGGGGGGSHMLTAANHVGVGSSKHKRLCVL